MNKTFSIALILGAASAAPGGSKGRAIGLGAQDKRYDDPEFLGFAAKYNKDVRDLGTFQQRQDRFHANQNEINAHNNRQLGKGPRALRLAVNWTADLEREEYLELLGLDQEAAESKKTKLPAHHDGSNRGQINGKGRGNGLLGRHLDHRASSVDHHADGFMSPVKNQGNCGSCWAFAATTTLEGTVAKKTNSAPVHMSEQQLVDCTYTFNQANFDRFGKDYYSHGCNGGWMSWAWDFMKDQGIMLDSDYPYQSGNTSTEHACEHDESKVIGYVQSWTQITGSVQDIKDRVDLQPVSVALDAGSSAFQFYSSGVVMAEDNCGLQLNHAVVIVGYSDGDTSPTPEPSPEPSPGPEPSPEPSPTPGPSCTVTKWWHHCETDDRRRLDDHEGLNNYWKVQNSWGSSWGDQGFIRIDIQDGDGVCGINNVVEFVDMVGVN